MAAPQKDLSTTRRACFQAEHGDVAEKSEDPVSWKSGWFAKPREAALERPSETERKKGRIFCVQPPNVPLQVHGGRANGENKARALNNAGGNAGGPKGLMVRFDPTDLDVAARGFDRFQKNFGMGL